MQCSETMTDFPKAGRHKLNRRKLLKYGSGALVSGLTIREMSTGAKAAQSASVDLASSEHPVAHNASGYLYGLSTDGTEPSDIWLDPVDSGLHVGGGAQLDGGAWALGGIDGYYTRWNMVSQQYDRMTSVSNDAEYVIRMSDLWGGDGVTLADSDPYPGDDGDWSSFNSFVDQVVSDVSAKGMDRSRIQYEIWNEPDYDLFWPRSTAQYDEMWQRAVQQIRNQDPNARIVGPGYTHYVSDWIAGWLDMTIDSGTEPDILNWHDLQTGDDAVSAAADARNLLSQRELSNVKLEINEYVPSNEENPGYNAWDLARVEKSDVDYAALANWSYCCNTGALCATLTQDGTQPNGRWWLYNRYGQTRGDVVTSGSSANIDSAANINPEGTQSRIVVGNSGFTGTFSFTLQNVDQINSSRIRVKVERIPDREPLPAPVIDQDYTVDISEGNHTVLLNWSVDTDAFVITVTEATPAIANGTYHIEAVHSGKYMEVAGAGTQNGDNVQQYSDTSCTCQQWNVENIQDSVYRIENVNSGKVLDVDGGSTRNDTNVFQWTDLGADNQRFYVEETRSGVYRIEAVHSGKEVDVEGAGTADGTNVHQWVDRSGDNQRWRFVPV